MIVVTTPTGHIGSAVVRSLLAAGEAVRVIAREPARLAAEVKDKLEVCQGASDDEGVVFRALEGADSLFLVVPPSSITNDVREHYLRFTRPVCRAIESRNVKRVVTVSGLGRRVPLNAGPISAAFAKDDEIQRTGVNFRSLWCAGFMENVLRQIDSLRNQGVFFSPGRPDVKSPLVATRDIASFGAKLLMDRSWSGQQGVAVLGPEDLSFDDMANIMTDVLDRPIRFQSLSGEEYKSQLMRLGATESFAQGLLDMFVARDTGLDNTEPRTAENTTATSFRQWCEEVLRPMFMQNKKVKLL